MPPERLIPRYLYRVWAPHSIRDWFPEAPPDTGEVWFERTPELPLLVKFVFAAAKLSVQVHPPDDYARRHHNLRGKTEMWHVLAAEPGARIAAGFREPVSRQRLRAAAVSGEIMDLLAWQDACPGDTFFLPAGTVHALSEGLILCEIQQNSDLTYRLYDYGRGRELHLEHALRVSDRGARSVRQPERNGALVSCEYFRTEKIALRGSRTHTPESSRLELWVVLDGRVHIAGQAAARGSVWYVAPSSQPFELAGQANLLRTSGPA